MKLARTPVSVHKILVVMLAPRSQDDSAARHDRLDLRHCCYWINLAGHARPPAGAGPPCVYRPRASSTGRSARS